MSERVRPVGEWDLGEVVDPAEFELLDEGQAEAVDGRGGSYSPTTPILIGGRGVEDCNAEHHLYDSATGNVTIGPTNSHRIRVFGGQHINGVIVVLINDDAAFTRKSVYVSQLNVGSRIRIRNSANTFDYVSYSPVETQTDVEVEVERTEETGSTAWRRTRVSRRSNESSLAKTDLAVPSTPYENEYDLLRITDPVEDTLEIVLPAAKNGSERVVVLDRVSAVVLFSNETAGAFVHAHSMPTGWVQENVTLHFWRREGAWRHAYTTHGRMRPLVTFYPVLPANLTLSFDPGITKRFIKVTSWDTGGTQKILKLNNGAFPGQEFHLDHASPEYIIFRNEDDTEIATVVFNVELSPGRKRLDFYWDGGAWNYTGFTTPVID